MPATDRRVPPRSLTSLFPCLKNSTPPSLPHPTPPPFFNPPASSPSPSLPPPPGRERAATGSAGDGEKENPPAPAPGVVASCAIHPFLFSLLLTSHGPVAAIPPSRPILYYFPAHGRAPSPPSLRSLPLDPPQTPPPTPAPCSASPCRIDPPASNSTSRVLSAPRPRPVPVSVRVQQGRRREEASSAELASRRFRLGSGVTACCSQSTGNVEI
ncbi:hypothetical protein ZWY2020_015011 [Hordeum vulgare]|nr:hypothetical protein ZWY2020_015011 [Hordeum vulgare]